MLLSFLGAIASRICYALFGIPGPTNPLFRISNEIQAFIENGSRLRQLFFLVFLYVLILKGGVWLWEAANSTMIRGYTLQHNRGHSPSGDMVGLHPVSRTAEENAAMPASGTPVRRESAHHSQGQGSLLARIFAIHGAIISTSAQFVFFRVIQLIGSLHLLYHCAKLHWDTRKGHSDPATPTSTSERPKSSSDWIPSDNPDDIIAVGQALKDIIFAKMTITRTMEETNNKRWSSWLKRIACHSEWLGDQLKNIPYGASPLIRKSVETHRLILFDMNEAIEFSVIIPPDERNSFDTRIDAWLEEFKKALVMMRSEGIRPPDNPSHRHSSHWFENAHNVLITGGNFVQNTTEMLDRTLSAKILRMQYLTLGLNVLFG